MGVVDGEEESGLFGAEGLEAVGGYGGHVDYGDVLGGSELALKSRKPMSRSMWGLPSGPGVQMLRMVTVRRMGVACLARVSAMYLRRYQP